jgi:hypothetical protein
LHQIGCKVPFHHLFKIPETQQKEMCVGYRDESSGGAGRAQAPPTAENPLKPLLSLPYKFEEEGGRKEELKEGEGEKSPPPPLKLILDPSLMGYFITTKKCLPLRK